METKANPCLSRRSFLLVGGTGAALVMLGDLFPGTVLAQDAEKKVRFQRYPRKQVGWVSRLRQDQPFEFQYPDDSPHGFSQLYKLGRKAGGGVGPDQDIVAFNGLCTHQGGPLKNKYNAEHKIAGSCPHHLTTFDLTRHGIVVAGHATDNLPQIVLEIKGDEIHAIGIVGLIYGYPDNVAFVEEK